MNIDCKISILIGAEGTTIEIKDSNASITFAKVSMTPEELSRALSREMYVSCTAEVDHLDRVGKKHENESFEFKLPEEFHSYEAQRRNPEGLAKYAQSLLKDGWVAEAYFGSQKSFFTKDGEKWARCTIRRWI